MQRGFKKKGKRHRLTLGEYPTVSLEGARGRANLYIDQANKGISPIVALERAATTGGLTIEGLSKRFLADYVQMKELRALAKYARAINARSKASSARNGPLIPMAVLRLRRGERRSILAQAADFRAERLAQRGDERRTCFTIRQVISRL